MDEVGTAQVSEFTDYHAVGDFAPFTLQGRAICLQRQHTETESLTCNHSDSNAAPQRLPKGGSFFSFEVHRPSPILYSHFSTQGILNLHKDQ